MRNAAFAWLELYRAMLNYHRNRNSYNCMDVLFEPCESSDPPTLRYDLTSRRVTVGLTMIQRPVKWCLNLFPLFLFLSSPLLLLAVILSSILTSLLTDPLPLSPSISLFRYARVSYFLPVPISLKCQAHEQSEIRRYKRRCPLYYVCFI